MGLYNNYIKPFFNARANHKAIQNINGIIGKVKASAGYGNYGNMYSNSVQGGAKFNNGLNQPGFFLSHYRTRQNARTAYQTSLPAKTVVDRLVDTVADTGLFLEATPVSDILGITSEQAEKWSNDVEQRFDLWAKDKNMHRSGTMTFYQLQRLYQLFQHRDNDIFVRLYYSKDRKLQNPLQIEFLDPDQIRGDTFTSSLGGYQFGFDGINRDAQGREKSYKVWVLGKDNKYINKVIPRIGPKSGRVMMLHGFSPEYAGQGRGLSKLSHALQEFQQITDFTMAQIEKAISNSMISGYVVPSSDAPAGDPFEGGVTSRELVNQFGSDPNPSPDAQNVNIVNFHDITETVSRTPGAWNITTLGAGEDLKEFGKSAPSDSYDSFVGSFVSTMAASFSIPMEVLMMKFNSNYSASRAALILFWRVSLIWRAEMKSDFIDPIYEMWLSGEIASGRVTAPGWSDPILKRAWLNSNVTGSPMPNIDPMRTAKATREYLDMGLTTLSKESRDLNNTNAKANRAKNRKDFSEVTTLPTANKGASNNA